MPSSSVVPGPPLGNDGCVPAGVEEAEVPLADDGGAETPGSSAAAEELPATVDEATLGALPALPDAEAPPPCPVVSAVACVSPIGAEAQALEDDGVPDVRPPFLPKVQAENAAIIHNAARQNMTALINRNFLVVSIGIVPPTLPRIRFKYGYAHQHGRNGYDLQFQQRRIVFLFHDNVSFPVCSIGNFFLLRYYIMNLH